MRFIRTAYYNSEVPVFNFGVMKLTECGLSGPPSQGSNGADYWSKSADAKNVTLQDLVAVSLSLVHVTHTHTGPFSPPVYQRGFCVQLHQTEHNALQPNASSFPKQQIELSPLAFFFFPLLLRSPDLTLQIKCE